MPDLTEMRRTLAAAYDLAPSLKAAEATAAIHAKMDRVVPLADWARHAPYVQAINRLKRDRNAVILAHNYMTPDIFHGVADVVGDSLQEAVTRLKKGAPQWLCVIGPRKVSNVTRPIHSMIEQC